MARRALGAHALASDWHAAAACTGDCQEFRVRVGGCTSARHGLGETLAEEDGELGLGHRPLARRHPPLLLGAVQDQEEELQGGLVGREVASRADRSDRKSTRLNSSHANISYAVFCLKQNYHCTAVLYLLPE